MQLKTNCVYRFYFFLLLCYVQTGFCVLSSEHRNIMSIFITREFGSKKTKKQHKDTHTREVPVVITVNIPICQTKWNGDST